MRHTPQTIEKLLLDSWGNSWGENITYETGFPMGRQNSYLYYLSPFETSIPHYIEYSSRLDDWYEDGINPRDEEPNFPYPFPHELQSNWPTADTKRALKYFSYAIYYYVNKFFKSEIYVNPIFIGTQTGQVVGTLGFDGVYAGVPSGVYIKEHTLPIPLIETDFDYYWNNSNNFNNLVQESEFQDFWTKEYYGVDLNVSLGGSRSAKNVKFDIDSYRDLWNQIFLGHKGGVNKAMGLTREKFDEHSVLGEAGRFFPQGWPRINKYLHKYANSRIDLSQNGSTNWQMLRILQNLGENITFESSQVLETITLTALYYLNFRKTTWYSVNEQYGLNGLQMALLSPFFIAKDELNYVFINKDNQSVDLFYNEGDPVYQVYGFTYDREYLVTKVKINKKTDNNAKLIKFNDDSEARILKVEEDFIWIEGDHTGKSTQEAQIFSYTTIQIPGTWIDSPLSSLELNVKVDNIINNGDTSIIEIYPEHKHQGIIKFTNILYNTFNQVILDEINNLKITFPQDSWDILAIDNGIWGINTKGTIK